MPNSGPGVFVVELPAPVATAPIELTRVGKWLERVETLRLDGDRPTSRALAARLARFWLPSQVVLYVGATSSSVGGRVRALRETTLGERRPHSGGHWLHVLTGLERARIWWAATDASEEYEDALLGFFAERVPTAERASLPDAEVVLPFANLRTPSGVRKRTGLTGSIREAPAPPPPRRVVELPDGDADGARAEPPPRRSRTRAPVTGCRSVAPRSEPRAKPVERIQLTADGAERLRAELRMLVEKRRPEVIARIRAAKELGDLKENADYTAAREEQSFLEGRIQSIEALLRGAQVVHAPRDKATIALGSEITLDADGEHVRYTLVGSSEADPGAGRISVASPVGRALLGHGPGDDVMVRTPQGEARYRVLSVG